MIQVEHRNFCNQLILPMDRVVYLKKLRTGSSTTRKLKCQGIVREIKKSQFIIECIYCEDGCAAETGDIHKLNNPNDIICNIGQTVYGIKRNDVNESN